MKLLKFFWDFQKNLNPFLKILRKKCWDKSKCGHCRDDNVNCCSVLPSCSAITKEELKLTVVIRGHVSSSTRWDQESLLPHTSSKDKVRFRGVWLTKSPPKHPKNRVCVCDKTKKGRWRNPNKVNVGFYLSRTILVFPSLSSLFMGLLHSGQ